MKKAIIFLLVGVLLAGCSTAKISPITHIYAFGDDFSDNGNCYKLMKEAYAQGKIDAGFLEAFETSNWEGRLSNGPVAVEVMADRLKVDLTDYAVCAALSGHSNMIYDVDTLNNTGLLGQIDKFESDLNGEKADAGALYFVEIGLAEFYFKTVEEGNIDNDVITGLADLSVNNLTNAVTRLARLGAKQFLIGNSLDLSHFPGFIIWGIPDKAELFQTRMNSALPGETDKLAQQLDVKIDIFDYVAAGDRIQSDPTQYGLTNLTDPCTNQPESSDYICENPDGYYYWGYVHLTRRTHQIMGEAMADQLSK